MTQSSIVGVEPLEQRRMVDQIVQVGIVANMVTSTQITPVDNTLIDVGAFNGCVIMMLNGAADGQFTRVLENSATSITLEAAFDTDPSPGDRYALIDIQPKGLTLVNVINTNDMTATEASIELSNRGHKGIAITLTTSDLVGSTATYTVQLRDVRNNVWFEAAAAVTTAGTAIYLIYPGLGAAADGITEIRSYPIPYRFDINVVVASADGSNNMDVDVDIELIP